MIFGADRGALGSVTALVLVFGGGLVVGTLADLPRFTDLGTVAALMRPMHSTLPVRDLEAAAQWYEQTLGFTRIELPDHDGPTRSLLLARDSNLIELKEGVGGAQLTGKDVGYSVPQARVAIEVNDVDAEAASLREKGIILVVEPRPARGRELRISLLRDPNGHMLEFQEPQ